MRIRTLLFVIPLTSCAAEPPCQFEPGRLYELTARELSGDCGDLETQLTTGGTVPPGCTQMDLAAGEGCGRSYRRQCVLETGDRADMLVALDRQDDDTTWAGRLDLTLRDAQGVLACRSVYAVTAAPR